MVVVVPVRTAKVASVRALVAVAVAAPSTKVEVLPQSPVVVLVLPLLTLPAEAAEPGW